MKNRKTIHQEDLPVVLRRWRGKGDRVVPTMDANEHVIDGAMYKQLTGEDLVVRQRPGSEVETQSVEYVCSQR